MVLSLSLSLGLNFTPIVVSVIVVTNGMRQVRLEAVGFLDERDKVV